MARIRRQEDREAPEAPELGLGPAQRGLELSTESRYLRAQELPRRLRQKPSKSFRAKPGQ